MTVSYYYKTILRDAIKLWKDLSWSNKEIRVALRGAISCVITFLIAYSLDFKNPFWALFTCLVLTQQVSLAGLNKSFLKVLATFCGALLAVVIYGLFIESYYMYSITLFLLTVFIYYKRGVSEKHEYFWWLILFNLLLISVVGYANSPTSVFSSAVYRPLEILLGIVVSTFVYFYLFPDNMPDELTFKLETLRRKIFDFHKNILTIYISGKHSESDVGKEYSEIKNFMADFTQMINISSLEETTNTKKLKSISEELNKLSYCSENVFSFYTNSVRDKSFSFQYHFSTLLSNMLVKFEYFLKAVNSRDKKLKRCIDREIQILMNNIEMRCNSLVRKERHRVYSVTDNFAFYQSLYLQKSLVEIYSDNPSEKKTVQVENQTSGHKTISHIGLYGFIEFKLFGKNFMFYAPALKHGIKVAIALIIVVWGWYYLELPKGQGGINICLAVLTVLQPDSITSNLKGLLRLFGCIIGGAIGFLFLGLQTDSTTIMLLCLFVVTFVSCYTYSAGGFGISLLGLETAYAYIATTIILSSGPITTYSNIVYRLAGIILGIFTIWAINKLFWDDNPKKIFMEQLQGFSESFKNIKFPFLDKEYIVHMSKDLKNIKVFLNKLKAQKDISEEEALGYYRNLNLMEQLLNLIDSITSLNKNTFDFFLTVDSKIFESINMYFHKLPEIKKNDNEETRKIIESILNDIEEIKLKSRAYGLLKNKRLSERQDICQLLFCLNHMVKIFGEASGIDAQT